MSSQAIMYNRLAFPITDGLSQREPPCLGLRRSCMGHKPPRFSNHSVLNDGAAFGEDLLAVRLAEKDDVRQLCHFVHV